MPDYDYPIVRDALVINDFKNFYTTYKGPGAAVLLARTVTLNADFRVDHGALIIVADIFDGNGFTINARGVDSGVLSTPGGNGKWPGYVPGPEGVPAGPGGDGGNGTNGGDGTHAGSVTLFCREARNVRILASGGNGTNGAPGGNGSAGVNGFFRDGWIEPGHTDPDTGEVTADIEHPPIEIWGTSGGSGGWGGTGGNAGNGGTVTFTRIIESGLPTFDVAVGQAGSGAPGGSKGGPGAYGEDAALDGNYGDNGTPGQPGSLVTAFAANDAEFGALIRPLIGDNFANHWGPFRVAMGDYHYRQYNPPLASDETHPSTQHIRDATREFSCGLELQPDNAMAKRLMDQLVGWPRDGGNGEQIWVGGGVNALGFPRELDLLPDFETYKTAFDASVPPLLQFLQVAANQLTAVTTQNQLLQLAATQRLEAEATRGNLALDIPVAEREKEFAEKDVEFLDTQLIQIRGEIETNIAEMSRHEFNLGEVFGTLAEVGAAVVGIMAAVPTLGTSLVGLVPAMVALSNTVLNDADDIAKALFAGTKVDDRAVKEAYDKVDKKADAVIKSGKTIVNFIKVIKEIGSRATPDNAQHVALVKRGVEVTHQLLMAGNRVTLAGQRHEAAKAKVGNLDGVIEQADKALASLGNNGLLMKNTGLLALMLVNARSDAAMRMAFRAQRSVEIYTLRDQSDKVHLDTGVISPEVYRQYYDGEIAEIQLVSELIRSWGKLLDPIRLHEAYVAYFDAPHGTDWYRKSFYAGPEIESLKANYRFSFRIDPADLPGHHLEAKVRSIRLALVGAEHPNQNISCEIKRGAIYEHRLADGSILKQSLQPLMDRRPAKLGQLSPEEGFAADPPLTAPSSLAFWGRGVCGTWEISIPEDQLANGKLDLSRVSWIQVWIGYQYIQGPA
jgi:hypothetical protein